MTDGGILSLKEELETWAAALESYDKEEYEKALEQFNAIAESSRIWFNVGIIHATIGQHEEAIRCFRQACDLDVYLAIAFFQCGVSLFLLGRYQEALAEFDTAYALMRSNLTIVYDQIGLKFRLYSCEILFNRGLSLIYLQRFNEGMQLLGQARTEKQIDEHNVIDEAFAEQAGKFFFYQKAKIELKMIKAGFTVFSIPVGVLYRPAESKLKNLKAKNYLGQARLVAATSAQDAFVGFTGSTRAKMAAAYSAQRKSSSASDTRLEMAQAAARANPEPFDLAFSRPKRVPTTALPKLPSQKPSTETTDKQPIITSKPSLRSPHMRQMSTPLSNSGSIKARSTPFATDVRPLALQRSKTVLPVNPPAAPPTPPESQNGADDEVLRDLYADYDGPAESIIFETPAKQRESQRQPMGQAQSRVADWARKNASMSTNASAYPRSVAARTSYDDLPKINEPSRDAGPDSRLLRANSRTALQSNVGSDSGSITRVRLKLHHNGSIRAMSVTPDLALSDLLDLISNKLGKDKIQMQFKDEDGSMIDMIDESDWQSGIETAQDQAKGKNEGKLEIWIS